MNRRMVVFLLSRIMLIEAVLMLPSVLVGLIYREAITWCFLPAIGALALLGLFGIKKPKDTTIYAREGFLVVAAAWVLMSLFGAVPLWLCGGFNTFWDCLFEIVSGFTTTGASILETVEQLPHCILFWRSFSHWVGGMGVLVFVLAVMPMSEERSMHLMRAEVPGPVKGKLVPRMRDTAKILYTVYSVLTLILVVLLWAGGMPLFESICHAFGAAGTGGFSVKNASIKAYDSTYIHVVLSTFMLLFGVNFSLYHLILIGKWKNAVRSEELHVYGGIVVTAVVLITINTFSAIKGFGLTLRDAYFQVSSIITTTGYATVNFDQWPGFSKMTLLLLMVFGACAGSTGGGLKISRVVILFKAARQEVRRLLHPRAVTVVRMEGKPVGSDLIRATLTFFLLYVVCLATGVFLLSLGEQDFLTNFTATLACLSNIGPGLALVGPTENYGFYSSASKVLLSLEMLAGRLELFPIILLFSPLTYRHRSK
ncbi:MAG: TrkH family potassium uptake protein [Clostridia bacterium]|nr:TrkH family potassium uptake protein [Clostridia bacterium]